MTAPARDLKRSLAWPPQCATHPFDLPLPEPREDSRPVTGPPDPNDDGYDNQECPR